MHKPPENFDYIIVGNGLAGLQLALKFAEDSFFDSKTFGLIDPLDKSENDKSWSFWEKGKGQWEKIIHKSWNTAKVITSKKSLTLPLAPYVYKTIRSVDFYNYAKSILSKKDNFKFISDEVMSIEKDNTPLVIGKLNSFSATHVFDSRIPTAFFSSKTEEPLKNNSINIKQHFKGIFIKTSEPKFNPSELTMMDYRLKDGEQTTFTYVLPFSETEALIEFTYFTPEIVSEKTYDHYLEKYISEILNISDYKITGTEVGVIPMSTFPFEKFSSKNITKIGTGGAWVKASTGYSFKHTEKKVETIITNIKNGHKPSSNLICGKYKFYDKVFLKVLRDENQRGEWIFGQFYKKNSVQTMFKFLDEESSFSEELKIMWSLFSWSFIKAFFKTL